MEPKEIALAVSQLETIHAIVMGQVRDIHQNWIDAINGAYDARIRVAGMTRDRRFSEADRVYMGGTCGHDTGDGYEDCPNCDIYNSARHDAMDAFDDAALNAHEERGAATLEADLWYGDSVQRERSWFMSDLNALVLKELS